MKRLLITGGSGLLGLNWACCLRERYEIVLGLHRRRVKLAGTRSLDLALDSPHRLAGQIEQLAPDIIVHTAGMTNVDQCERQPREAEHANAQLAQNVAIAGRAVKARLVHVSTDHLFSGARPLVTERETPLALNAYARTKLEAERRVAEADPNALIVRTNFFGWGPPYRQSISDRIICSLRAGRPIRQFDDVYFTPILIDELASASHEALELGASGPYHIVGDERISKYAFAEKLARHFGLPERLIQRGSIGESSLSAPRPRDMSLSNARLRALLGRDMGSVDAFMQQLLRQEQDGRPGELSDSAVEGELNVYSGR